MSPFSWFPEFLQNQTFNSTCFKCVFFGCFRGHPPVPGQDRRAPRLAEPPLQEPQGLGQGRLQGSLEVTVHQFLHKTTVFNEEYFPVFRQVGSQVRVPQVLRPRPGLPVPRRIHGLLLRPQLAQHQ